MNPIIKEITAHQVKNDITPFKVGDGVRVHTKVREGDKERVQIYSGIVIARKGHGIHESFTVRRISYGEGVERIFPIHSPRVDKVEVERQGRVRRVDLADERRGVTDGVDAEVGLGGVRGPAVEDDLPPHDPLRRHHHPHLRRFGDDRRPAAFLDDGSGAGSVGP